MTSFWGELKRRNVVRVAIAYAVVAWLSIEVSATTFPMLRLPEWAATFVTVLLIIGFPVAVIFAWAYELTPEGLKKEKDVDRSESITHITGRKLDFVIIGVLVVAVGFLLVDKLYLSEGDTAADEVTVTERQSIAVLPFVNMSDDPGNEYFSDGISEELLNVLTRIPGLRVVARTSSFQFKGENRDIIDIGQRLNVAHILEGSVRKAGRQIRITAQLVDARSGFHLWSETYDRDLENIFAVQDEIAATVVESLRVTLLGELPKAQRTDPEAYSLFLKSKVPARRFTKEGFEEASRLLMQVLAIDPEYAQAWGELAINQTNQALWKKVNPEEGYARAQASARRALSLDPNNVRALVALGAVEMFWNWDFVAAGEWFRKAHEVAPGDAAPLTGLAYLTGNFGRADAALELFQEAVDRDPLNLVALGNLALANSSAGRFDIARSHIEAMKQIDPESAYITGRAGGIEMDQGNFEEALRHADQMESPYNVLRACALHSLGRFAEARAELDGYQQRDTPHAVGVADIYVCWGEVDRAFEWLERAYEEHDPNLITSRADSNYQILHDDPRWEALLQKLGLSDEHAEKLGL